MLETHTRAIAEALDVIGLVNVQYAVKGNQVFVHRGEPAGQPHRAVRGEGDERAAGEGRGPGDGRRDAGRAARRGPAAACRRAGTLRSRKRCCRSTGSPTPTRCSVRRCARPARSWASTARSGWPSRRARWRPATRCRRAGWCSCRSPIATRPSPSRRRRCSSTSASRSRRRSGPPTRSRAAASPSTSVVAKLGEPTGGDAVDAVDLIGSGKVELVDQQPAGRGARADGDHIRSAAAVHSIPCLTTAAAGHRGGRRHRRLGPPRPARPFPAGVPPRRRPISWSSTCDRAPRSGVNHRGHPRWSTPERRWATSSCRIR